MPINTIDLFAGCGGLLEGFESEGSYSTIACVEWEKAPCENLKNHLKTKWGHSNADNEVIRFDMQRVEELLGGYDDSEYGSHPGLDSLVGNRKIHIIIGGPPCQAYSLAGRIRDKNGMREDYRNYLFESYLAVVNRYKPNFCIFENVQGMLSAAPDGTPIIKRIKKSFEDNGYRVTDDFNSALFDLSEFGVPQNRKRIIILGVNRQIYGDKCDEILKDFYHTILPSYRCEKCTVNQAIGDLPGLYPLEQEAEPQKKCSHTSRLDSNVPNHAPRFHNKRDMEIFRMLAADIATGQNRYTDTKKLKELYSTLTGKKSNVHKYYVLRVGGQSNTIPAHLYKDGLRHIHPDPTQMRSITVREAARLQTFPDDYIFIGSMMHQFKMIGNAVPPRFSLALAKAVKQLINKYQLEGLNMLFYQNLKDFVFGRHELFDVDELIVLSGYLGPQPVSQLQTLPLKSTVIFGMYGSEGIGEKLHNALCRLKGANPRTEILYSNLPVHSKCYIWRKNGKIVTALIGSANFSVSGLSNDYREVLAETTFDTFAPLSSYLDIVLANCIPCSDPSVKLKMLAMATSPTGSAFATAAPTTGPALAMAALGVCRATLLQRNGEVPSASGLNWGLANAHVTKGDAYIKISKSDIENHPRLYPPKQREDVHVTQGAKAHRQNDAVELIWDDGTVMGGLLEGTQWMDDIAYPKQMCSGPQKNILGIYLRNRLGVDLDHYVTRADLDAYGRTDIDISLQSEGVYYLDFSV